MRSRLIRPVAVTSFFAIAARASVGGEPTELASAIYAGAAKAKDHFAFRDRAPRRDDFAGTFPAIVASTDDREAAFHDAALDFAPILMANGEGGGADLGLIWAAKTGDVARVVARFGRGASRREATYFLAPSRRLACRRYSVGSARVGRQGRRAPSERV